jgi:phage terminase large subunit-like protein
MLYAKKNKDSKQLMQIKSAMLRDNEFTLSSPFGTNYLGKLVALGIGQGVHGRACDVGFLDDFCADLADSRSETMRQRLYDWYRVDWISRLQSNIKMVVTCTRWYENDPVGLMNMDVRDLAEAFGDEAPKGLNVKIRAEYRLSDDNLPDDPRSNEGDLLWDAMKVKYFLAKKAPDFEALYNCNPEALENLKQLKDSDFGYYDVLPRSNGRLIYSIDGASTTNRKSDRTAIGLWFVVGMERYLIKLWYVKLEIPDLIELVKGILDSQNYDDCLIEFANSGVALSQFLKEAGYKCTAIGFSGYEINSTDKRLQSDKIGKSNSKMDRYLRVLPEFITVDKRIWIPRTPIEHQKEFVKQMTQFTGADGQADDLVDMATMLIFYTQRNIIRVNSTLPHQNFNKNNQNKFALGNAMCYNVQNSRFMNYNRKGNING